MAIRCAVNRPCVARNELCAGASKAAASHTPKRVDRCRTMEAVELVAKSGGLQGVWLGIPLPSQRQPTSSIPVVWVCGARRLRAWNRHLRAALFLPDGRRAAQSHPVRGGVGDWSNGRRRHRDCARVGRRDPVRSRFRRPRSTSGRFSCRPPRRRFRTRSRRQP